MALNSPFNQAKELGQEFYMDRKRMAPKRDIKQIDDIGKKFSMSERERINFGKFIEAEKDAGCRGSKDRGDFTWEELIEKAREFFGEPS
ncbi:MAG: hypothetical protein ACRCU2_07360 [Planktothrix sp.]